MHAWISFPGNYAFGEKSLQFWGETSFSQNLWPYSRQILHYFQPWVHGGLHSLFGSINIGNMWFILADTKWMDGTQSAPFPTMNICTDWVTHTEIVPEIWHNFDVEQDVIHNIGYNNMVISMSTCFCHSVPQELYFVPSNESIACAYCEGTLNELALVSKVIKPYIRC